MSLQTPIKVQCPACQHQQQVEIWESINADLNPEAKAELFAGTINGFNCEACGQRAMVNAPLFYHDMTRQFCAAYEPSESLDNPGFYKRFNLNGKVILNLGLVPSPEYFLDQITFFTLHELLFYITFRERLWQRSLIAMQSQKEAAGEVTLAERWLSQLAMPVPLLDPLKFYAFIAASPHTLLCFISESGNADESVLKLFKSYPPEKFRDLPFAMLDVADHVGLQNSHPARRMNVCATPAFVLFQRGQELAMFMNRRGCASRSFVETKKGFDLIHGSELMAGRVLGYDRSKQRHQSDHCIPNILKAIEETFPPKQRAAQLRTLAGFIILDAIICNTDRHHDNWALIRGPFGSSKIVHRVAPSFDHASSLGRELRDPKRKSLLAQNLVARYVARAGGGIYWQVADAKGSNPLDLAVQAAKKYPEFFSPWLALVRQLQVASLESILARVPVDWMSIDAKQFCVKMMTVTIETLKEVQL